MTTKDLPGPPWTILATLQWTAHYFKKHAVESPRAAAEILLAHGLGCRRLDLYLRYDQPLNPDELARFRTVIKRRASHEPVAYIVGIKEFWSLDFKVDPSVLIPRPETEGLVEAALEHLTSSDRESGETRSEHRILELGTGSGAVIISLAHERPQSMYWATELSVDTLAIARENARRHLMEDAVHFLAGKWFAPLNPAGAHFDLILSNPPYVPSADIAGLAPEVHCFEPRLALDGGPDGLRDVVHLIEKAPGYLKPGGMLMLEIGWDQFGAVAEYGRNTGAYQHISVRKDYAGHDRIACLRTGI